VLLVVLPLDAVINMQLLFEPQQQQACHTSGAHRMSSYALMQQQQQRGIRGYAWPHLD
jgi:hypothetical protein